MSSRDDHAARVMAGASEPQCWGALFDEIDQLRELLHTQEQAFDADTKAAVDEIDRLRRLIPIEQCTCKLTGVRTWVAENCPIHGTDPS